MATDVLTTRTESTTPDVADDPLGNREHYEIIDGVKVEMPPMSADSQFLASRVIFHLSTFGIARDLGEACGEVMFDLPSPINRSRRPDAAFIPYSRWRKNSPIPSTRGWDVIPDLCVEVVSPTDFADELMDKIGEYFAAGVRLVWVVYPRHQVLHVYESPTGVRGLGRADTLDGGPVLPGFTLKLADLFTEPAPPIPPPSA
jgi:Uma2 family endonuclease